ncbi:MAG: metalloregulator ArsR/SmtB family transcription factor [Chitinivibrionales bacterium]|nr:metalloregulator ArsR/SmtB family transcription factor [Chitinivibrionales bacterium]MBD3356982.1 metalloregulator ArsR/SmtB family transcription factor [Chitinivibrionales bacterium]
MKALAHPTRVCIAHELSKRERCVYELTEVVGADTSTISKHLSIMKNAGIIDSEKRGTSIYYSLKMTSVLNFFLCANEVLKERAESQMMFV